MVSSGLHFPGSLTQLRAWFSDDSACLDYLDWHRFSNGFECPHCGDVVAWQMSGDIRRCAGCRRRISRTSGTLFQDTRVPLTSWYEAAWWMTDDVYGVSAVALQHSLGLGSYQTAWSMLHRYRVAMGNAELAPLRGSEGSATVQITSRYQVLVRAELLDTGDLGRIKITMPTQGVERADIEPSALTPVIDSLIDWIASTHGGSISGAHMQAYLDEFVFRCNRRTQSQRGALFYQLLQAAIHTSPVTYRSLVAAAQAAQSTAVAITTGAVRKPDPDTRPWRTVKVAALQEAGQSHG